MRSSRPLASAAAIWALVNWVFRFPRCAAAGGRFQVVGGPEILQRPIAFGGLLLQFDQAVLQPLADDFCRLKLAPQRGRDIAVGQRIRDFCRLVAGIFRLERRR